ncbi:hypothetical protein Q9Q94_08765 [Uliginosibacterium sp. 31-16]|uniref:hypothetical protein n=1 Tax=Uliginosibacterium sp. 31-16 TaxID=3068315 RepID=UPI00273D25C1|nr:hypothetical protein [Uliginosibacterium sp. 31-16]MDP5239619.1 hypothetical protein [Uliginosibacterium sp. 31-16]
MSRLRHKRFSLGVGSDDLSVVDAASMRLLTSLPLAEYLPGAASPATADWTPSIEAVLAQANVPEGGDLTLTVADAWARYFMLTVPAGVGSLSELRMLAAGRFETLFGTAPEGWQLAADWKASGRTLVCALPARLVEVVQVVAEASNWRVRSIQPYALRLLELFHKQVPDACWLCCFASRGMVALLVSGGEVQHVRRFPFAKAPDAAALSAMLEAEVLRAGLEMPTQLCALGVLPEMPVDGRVGSMRLVLPQGPKLARARPGQTSESVSLAMQGALA